MSGLLLSNDWAAKIFDFCVGGQGFNSFKEIKKKYCGLSTLLKQQQ